MLVLPERERTKKGAIGVETKGVTCKIPLDLHNQISEEIRETESTMSKFIEMIIREHYEKGANRIMEKGRTLAFQVSEELFQRVSPSTALITPSTMLSMRKNLPVPKTENRWKERSIRLSIKTSQNRIYSSQPSAVP